MDQVVQDPAYKGLESYELKDSKTGRFLVFEGVYHAGNPLRQEDDARMMRRLQRRFETFVSACREVGSEPLVIIEGGIPSSFPIEESEARKNEKVFISFLARRAGVCVESPEPSDLEQAEHLLARGYSPEQILSVFVLRQLKDRASKTKETELIEPVTNLLREQITLLDRLKPGVNLSKGKFPKESYRASIQAWFEYAKTLSGDERLQEERAFKQYTREMSITFIRAAMDGVKKMDEIDLVTSEEGDFVGFDVKRLNEYSHLEEEKVRHRSINRAFGEMQYFRDQKIVTEIANAKESGKDVFVVFGSYHATAQKPALWYLYA